jgi:predicted metal-dependent HD superfamily phosphohydrolase
MKAWLKNQWSELALAFCEDKFKIESFWQEIEKQYTLKIRHYHNLSHIYNMLLQTESIKDAIVDYDSFRFAVWYHDIIYKPTKKDNEEKSAVLAKNRLKMINIEENQLKMIKNLIISTKSHKVILNKNLDNSYLLDIDLSILGSDWGSYQKYILNIRKEYAIYPHFIYKKGRKKVLQNFLDRKTLYFTESFQSKFETQARQNILKEIELL